MFRILLLKWQLLRGKLKTNQREKAIKTLKNMSLVMPVLLGLLFGTFAAIFAANIFGSNDFLPRRVMNYEKPGLLISLAVTGLAIYSMMIRKSIVTNTFSVLMKNSVKQINKQLDAQNLLDKKIIITNISNGKKLGLTRDATIVAVIPQKRRFVIFEMFLEFIEIRGKSFPLFMQEKLNIIDINSTLLTAINGFHQRGDMVPQHIVKKIELIQKYKDELVKFDIMIDEIISPDQYTIFELCSTVGDMQFRSYRFKEILYAVYPKLVSEGGEEKLSDEISELKSKLAKYKKKIIEIS